MATKVRSLVAFSYIAESVRISQYDKFQDDEQRGGININNSGVLVSSGHEVIFRGVVRGVSQEI